jgi:RimJ/RimL family protein N-acetyltransferase
VSGAAALALRPARDADCERFFAWVNEPGVRRASFVPAPIPRDVHERWFAARLADPRCRLYVIESGPDVALGQIRLDLDGAGAAVVSISLDPAVRGRGLAAAALRLAVEAGRAGGVARFDAYIRPENAASLRAFARAGFAAPRPVVRQGTPALVVSLGAGALPQPAEIG